MNKTHKLLVEKCEQIQQDMFKHLSNFDEFPATCKSYDQFVGMLTDSAIQVISDPSQMTDEEAALRRLCVLELAQSQRKRSWFTAWKYIRALEDGSMTEDEVLLDKLSTSDD